MAVTKIWPVKGSLARPLEYIAQDHKTIVQSEPLPSDPYSVNDIMTLRHIMDFQGQEQQRLSLEKVLGYVAQGEKTDEEKFVTGINCLETTALEEMNLVKKQWDKEGGIVCFHAYQSFVPGEVTPELAHTIGLELAGRLWGDRFQVVVATHVDREHIHNHFALNSVSFMDGKRFDSRKLDYDILRITSDQLCREYSLSVIERPQKGRGVNPKAYEKAGLPRPESQKPRIKRDIDEVIPFCRSMDDFYRMMRQKGYTFRQGNLKVMSLRPPGAGSNTRLSEKNFGFEYTREGIAQRIAGNSHRAAPCASAPRVWDTPAEWEAESTPDPIPSTRKIPFRGKYPQKRSGKRKATGFRGLYLYYCYVFGVFPKRKQSRSYVPRNEIRRMRKISSATKLLITNRIDTVEQLAAYRASRLFQLNQLRAERKPLYNQLRHASDTEAFVIQAKINQLNSRIKDEREKVRLCDDIKARAERNAKYGIGLPPQEASGATTTTIEEKEEINSYGSNTRRHQSGRESDHIIGH